MKKASVPNRSISHRNEKINALPHNPIRAELVKWERNLPVSKQRRSYETIQQWLTRIGCSHEIVEVYEKIRYGDLAFTPDENNLYMNGYKNIYKL